MAGGEPGAFAWWQDISRTRKTERATPLATFVPPGPSVCFESDHTLNRFTHLRASQWFGQRDWRCAVAHRSAAGANSTILLTFTVPSHEPLPPSRKPSRQLSKAAGGRALPQGTLGASLLAQEGSGRQLRLPPPPVKQSRTGGVVPPLPLPVTPPAAPKEGPRAAGPDRQDGDGADSLGYAGRQRVQYRDRKTDPADVEPLR
jgi:hypothetical protein